MYDKPLFPIYTPGWPLVAYWTRYGFVVGWV